MGKLFRSTGLVEKTTIHGLRSSFRDWCAETGKPRELAEAALAHTVGGVEGAYFRSDLLDRRRALMAEWARYLAGDAATVVKLRARQSETFAKTAAFAGRHSGAMRKGTQELVGGQQDGGSGFYQGLAGRRFEGYRLV